jgi:L,D-transpeptidase YbiS
MPFPPWHRQSSGLRPLGRRGQGKPGSDRVNPELWQFVQSRGLRLPRNLILTCRRLGIRLTTHLLVVRVGTQQLIWLARSHFVGGSDPSRSPLATYPPRRRFQATRHVCTLRGSYLSSTSRFGVGQQANSNCTPLGLHRVAAKIGAGRPIGTVFEGRRPVGLTWRDRPGAPIAHRILWLEGLESGYNRGGVVDSFRRCIYIHGVGDEPSLGRPASRGCIHLAAADILPLFDRLPLGSLVWIE